MADITVGGKELTFDLDKLAMKDFRRFASGGLLNEEDDKVLAQVTGEPVEFFGELSQPDYRRVLKAFFTKAGSPLSDPN